MSLYLVSKLKTVIAVLALGWIASAGTAENMIFNSGFELDDVGFGCVKYLRRETNPLLTYEGPKPDKSTAVSGRQSLYIPNRFAEATELITGEFKLNPQTRYTMSLWMKSRRPSYPVSVILCAARAEKWQTYAEDFKVGTQWQRYSFKFMTDEIPDWQYSLIIRQSWQKDDPGGDLWLDELQLTVGKENPYLPGSEVEIAVIPDRTIYVLGNGKIDGTLNVAGINYGGQPYRETVRLVYAEAFAGGKKKIIASLELDIPPRSRKNYEVAFSPSRYGIFSVETIPYGSRAVKTSRGDFAVIGIYERKTLDLENSFYVGICGGIGFESEYPEKPGIPARGGGPEDIFAKLSLMGCRLLRSWDSRQEFNWKTIEEVKGKNDYYWSDKAVALAEKYDMTILPVIGGSEFLCRDKEDSGWPAWIRRQCIRRELPQWWKENSDFEYVGLPPVALWRKYVRGIAERYRGRLHYYEIVNEPNIFLDPTDYLPYLQSAWEEINAVDKDNKVVGFSSTGDLDGNMADFLLQCFDKGGLRYADIVSFHPYGAADLSSPIPADEGIAIIHNLMKTRKCSKPLWNTELYYLHDLGENASQWKKEHTGGEYAAWRFLTDLGEGVKQSAPAEINRLWRNVRSPNFCSNIALTALHPSDTFVVYNALARIFEGAKPLDKLRWNNTTVCYVFQKNRQYLAAFWNYENKPIAIKLNMTAAQGQLYDMFGNMLPWPSGALPLDARPFYLSWKGSDHGNFVRCLKNSKIVNY